MATNGAAEGSRAKPKDFPPRWFAKLLKTLFACLHYALVAAVAYAAYAAAAHLQGMHAEGALLPLLHKLAAWPVTLPASQLAGAAAVVLGLAGLLLWRRQSPIYLLDFECYRPDAEYKTSYHRFITGSQDSGFFDDEAMDFQTRILHKSGLSQETFFPPGLCLDPPEFDMVWARREAELVMFNAVGDLLKKTGLHPRKVDVLVTNCSLFNPTPSLSAMVINHFKMRNDVDSYNLAGMGCSAGVIAIGLAKKLLAERGRGGYALVVSTENITQNWYHGNERSMLIPNTIFRMGSAAILLTNKRSERRRSKYALEHVVRVHLGADDTAYNCIFQKPDARGFIGVELSKDLVKVASKAMTLNMTKLGPLVLPWSEKLAFAANWVARKVLRMRVPAYIPDFREAFQHFCLHAGGRGVVEGLSKQLELTPDQMAPSANTLHWYGNTSSSTVWYSFGFVESVQGVKKGDVVWQIGFGSGFKCNSAVWRALRNVKAMHKAWEHIEGREGQAMDTLHRIAAETAAERQQKAAAGGGGEAGGGEAGGAANGEQRRHAGGKGSGKAEAANGEQHHKEQEQGAANGGDGVPTKNGGGGSGRALRSGKVVAYAH